MFILIIEDDSQKAEKIKSLIEEIDPDGRMQICRSYQGGLRWLSDASHIVDLVVLDMSLPTFDPIPDQRPGRPRPLGGYDLMRKIRRTGHEPAVVVLTAPENFGSRSEQITFEELESRCATEFPDMFKGAIHYSQSSSAWRSELVAII